MSIDWWTIGLEVVNFLVLVWLLERLLYRPVLGVIDRRQAEIEQLQQADAAAHEALAAERDRLEAERQAVAAERARALEEAHAQAREERTRVEAEARTEMERYLAAGRARLEHERAEAVRALRRKSVELGVRIARRLLALSTPPGGDGRFVEKVCDRLRDLPQSERDRILTGLGEAAVVQVVTAEALEAPRQSECRRRIAEALGRQVGAAFSVDPALIAGIEIYFPGLVLRHSWRDTLADTEAALITEAGGAAAAREDDGHNAR